MLDLRNVEVAYDQVQVLFGLSLTVKPGEILCLLGAMARVKPQS